MPEVVGVTVFTIDELSPKAKEKAIQKIREGVESNDDLNEFFTQSLSELGYPIGDIGWRLSCSQGDGMAFYGKIEHMKKVALAIGLSEEKAEYLKDYSVSITRNSFGHHYSHWNTMTLNEEDVDNSQFYKLDEHGNEIKHGDSFLINEIYAEFRDALLYHIKETSKKLEAKGYEIIESNESDEACLGIARDNGYRFLESGKRWD